MAVTPNFSWPVPVATDYVKDGWEAISDLGNAIDTTVAGLGGDFVHLNTTTFTGSSAITLDSLFTSTYSNYKIIANGTSSIESSLQYRLRASGTDLTSSVYLFSQIERSNGGFYSNSTTIDSGYVATARQSGWQFEAIFTAPQLATNTFSHSSSLWNNSGSAYGMTDFGMVVNNTSQYDGIKFYPSTGTLTGTIRVYGLANS